jgi:hypothetical protein
MEQWKARDEIQDQMKYLVGQYHPDLALVVDKIVVMFREKAWNRRGGGRIYGKVLRPNATMNALRDEPLEFILMLGSDGWEHELTSRQRKALLDSLLCSCRCDEDDDEESQTGYKCYKVPPDVMMFRENVERFGVWMPMPDEENRGPQDGADLIEDVVKNGEQTKPFVPMPGAPMPDAEDAPHVEQPQASEKPCSMLDGILD